MSTHSLARPAALAFLVLSACTVSTSPSGGGGNGVVPTGPASERLDELSAVSLRLTVD